jgi:flagellum-specific peptidoglycan hydrolase FlgJ
MNKQDIIHLFGLNAQHAKKEVWHYIEKYVSVPLAIAQAIQESNCGHDAPGNNYFGIKGSEFNLTSTVYWSGFSTRFTTNEYVDGKEIVTQAYFRKYGSMAQSFLDHAHLLATHKAYHEAQKFAEDNINVISLKPEMHRLYVNLVSKVYATDPEYAKSVNNLIDEHKLFAYDCPTT